MKLIQDTTVCPCFQLGKVSFLVSLALFKNRIFEFNFALCALMRHLVLVLCTTVNGGWGGIRTHGGLSPSPVFKTGSLNHSDTHPIHRCYYAKKYKKVQAFFNAKTLKQE